MSRFYPSPLRSRRQGSGRPQRSRGFTAVVRGRRYGGQVYIDALRVLEACDIETVLAVQVELRQRLQPTAWATRIRFHVRRLEERARMEAPKRVIPAGHLTRDSAEGRRRIAEALARLELDTTRRALPNP